MDRRFSLGKRNPGATSNMPGGRNERDYSLLFREEISGAFLWPERKGATWPLPEKKKKNGRLLTSGGEESGGRKEIGGLYSEKGGKKEGAYSL